MVSQKNAEPGCGFVLPVYLGMFSRKASVRRKQSEVGKERINAYMHAKLLQLCPTLCELMDCSLWGSSVHGILQARTLEWAAMPSSRGSSRPRDWTASLTSPALAGGFFTTGGRAHLVLHFPAGEGLLRWLEFLCSSGCALWVTGRFQVSCGNRKPQAGGERPTGWKWSQSCCGLWACERGQCSPEMSQSHSGGRTVVQGCRDGRGWMHDRWCRKEWGAVLLCSVFTPDPAHRSPSGNPVNIGHGFSLILLLFFSP